MHRWTTVRTFAAIAAISISVSTGRAEWIKSYESFDFDRLSDVSADSLGNVYVAGTMSGVSAYISEGVLLKYDPAGNLQWQKFHRDLDHHYNIGVVADGLGNAFLSGHARSNSAGDPFLAHLSKVDASGTRVWTKYFGIPDADSDGTRDANVYNSGVAFDGAGGVYVAGFTDGNLEGMNSGLDDAYVSKFDVDGNALWTRQFGGTGRDQARGIATDGSGNVYVSGRINGNQYDAFLRKYDASGVLQGSWDFGTVAQDESTGVVVDAAGNIYLSGTTRGNLEGTSAGGADAFLRKYGADGSLQWTRQLGTGLDDNGLDVALDDFGNVFLTGSTAGSLGGASAGGEDAFLAKFDAAGTLYWVRQLGDREADIATAVASDGVGGAYLVGTSSWLGGDSVPGGGLEGFIARIPEPSAMAIAGAAAPVALAWQRRRRSSKS